MPCVAKGVVAKPKTCVYVLSGRTHGRERYYVGLTSDFAERLTTHNLGASPHTARTAGWEPHVVIQFPDEKTAARFERYLKSGSGRAFARRHFEAESDT